MEDDKTVKIFLASIVLMVVIAVAVFIFFTYKPPEPPSFYDKLTEGFVTINVRTR